MLIFMLIILKQITRSANKSKVKNHTKFLYSKLSSFTGEPIHYYYTTRQASNESNKVMIVENQELYAEAS